VVKAAKLARLTQEEWQAHMRTFQGTFHGNPDYALWYGWSEMVRSLREIQTMAAEMRLKR